MPAPDAIARLQADGIVRRDGDSYRTTRRFQAAMARAAFHLVRTSDEEGDLRFPIAHALVELYGTELPDAEMLQLIEELLPIERAELDPRSAPPVSAARTPNG
jgi:hypothetical protein